MSKPNLQKLADEIGEKVQEKRGETGLSFKKFADETGVSKEVLFKIYGKGKINFKENIFLDEFDYQEVGEFEGRISKSDFEKTYRLFYEKLGDYMLVWTLE